MKDVKAGLILLISQVVYVVSIVFWLIFAIYSLALLDTNVTANEGFSDVLVLPLVLFVWLYPLALIGTGIASWVLYHKRKFKRAVWIGLIPLLWVLAIIIFFNLDLESVTF